MNRIIDDDDYKFIHVERVWFIGLYTFVFCILIDSNVQDWVDIPDINW